MVAGLSSSWVIDLQRFEIGLGFDDFFGRRRRWMMCFFFVGGILKVPRSRSKTTFLLIFVCWDFQSTTLVSTLRRCQKKQRGRDERMDVWIHEDALSPYWIYDGPFPEFLTPWGGAGLIYSWKASLWVVTETCEFNAQRNQIISGLARLKKNSTETSSWKNYYSYFPFGLLLVSPVISS